MVTLRTIISLHPPREGEKISDRLALRFSLSP